MNIIAYNPDVDQLEKTYLSYRSNAGATVFKVKNSDKFVTGEKILIGAMSRERSEILAIVSTTPTTITTEASVFPHDADDPVYKLDYDMVRFYRSETGEGGAYVVMSGGEVEIDVDNSDGTTRYDDINSLDSFWYKMAYYNSVDEVESEYTPALKATGYDPDSAGYIIQAAARTVGDKDFMEWDIEDWLNSMNDIGDDLLTQSKIPYKFLKTEIDLDIEAGDTEVTFPTNLWKIDYVGINTLGTSSLYDDPKIFSYENFQRRTRAYQGLPGDGVEYMAYGDKGDRLHFSPAARTDRLGAFTLHYYKTVDRIENMASKIETPNGLLYKWGMLRDFYTWKADSDSKFMAKAKMYDQRYGGEVAKLQREKSNVAKSPSGFNPPVRRYRR
jgi:hypothetical protein